MIKIDTLYALYVYSINAKIQRNKDLIENYKRQSEEYLSQLAVAEPIISKYVNYSDVLNGYVKSIPNEFLVNANNELRYINITIKHYYELRAPMHLLADEIKTLSNKKITIKVYKDILRKCNNKIGDWLIRTGGEFNSPYFGGISLRHREDTNRVNWGKSNKNKKAILDRGGIPYNKEDEQRCIEAGIPYHGEKWLDKDHPNGLLVVYWQLNTFVKQYLPESLTVRFTATKGNYGIVKRLSDLYLTNVDYSLYRKLESPKEKYLKLRTNGIKE
jgi:hypothetical protein